MERSVGGWMWRLTNILLCLLMGGLVLYDYGIVVSYGGESPGEGVSLLLGLLPVFLLLIVPLLGCVYHVYWLFPTVTPETEARIPRIIHRLGAIALFEPVVLIAVFPIIYITAMSLGECMDSYRFRMGPYNLHNISVAEQEYQKAKGVYSDRFAELADVAPGLRDTDWSKPQAGYEYRLTISEGGRRFTATAVAGPKRKWPRDGYYVDETGVIRTAPEGATPDKNSEELFTRHSER